MNDYIGISPYEIGNFRAGEFGPQTALSGTGGDKIDLTIATNTQCYFGSDKDNFIGGQIKLPPKLFLPKSVLKIDAFSNQTSDNLTAVVNGDVVKTGETISAGDWYVRAAWARYFMSKFSIAAALRWRNMNITYVKNSPSMTDWTASLAMAAEVKGFYAELALQDAPLHKSDFGYPQPTEVVGRVAYTLDKFDIKDVVQGSAQFSGDICWGWPQKQINGFDLGAKVAFNLTPKFQAIVQPGVRYINGYEGQFGWILGGGIKTDQISGKNIGVTFNFAVEAKSKPGNNYMTSITFNLPYGKKAEAKTAAATAPAQGQNPGGNP